MQLFNDVLGAINSVIWHNVVLYVVLGVGVLFTIWSAFSQYRAITHGVAVTRGKFDDPSDPGAINHFQALSAALSATVGLGNIGGVAIALALGGPGAIFWMWVVGLFGMAIKTTEVTLSMLYRNTDDPDNPHGGPMWVASKGMEKMGFAAAGKVLGGIFCITLLISAITGGNMYQAWNVGIVTEKATGNAVPSIFSGIVLATVVGLVIIGGIKRIGAVAGRLVPFMCVMYLVAAFYVLVMKIGMIPEAFKLIFTSAFSGSEAQGAFIGGTFGYAFLWGMKRALFSSEAGQGSSPIAHSAAKSSEPVREAVVAGLEPFIDTLVVCTLTALVIICTGTWNRAGEAQFESTPAIVQVGTNDKGVALWTIGAVVDDTPENMTTSELPSRTDDARRIARGDWRNNDKIFLLFRATKDSEDTGDSLYRLNGVVRAAGDVMVADWSSVAIAERPVIADGQVFGAYPSAALTTFAFNTVTPGLGTWLVLLASWLFAISTMISWSYYGEQGVVFLFRGRGVLLYKIIYCGFIVLATLSHTLGHVTLDEELDGLTSFGTGVMLWANIPIMLIFGATAMRAYHTYIGKLKAGEFKEHAAPSITDVVSGKDVE